MDPSLRWGDGGRSRGKQFTPNGFTLVEMLVVLTILGIAAAIFAGQMRREPGNLQRSRAALTLQNAIAAAEREAKESGRAVSFDPAAQVSGASLDQPVFASPGGLLIQPDGSTSGGVIALDGRPLLRIDWLTGEVARVE